MQIFWQKRWPKRKKSQNHKQHSKCEIDKWVFLPERFLACRQTFVGNFAKKGGFGSSHRRCTQGKQADGARKPGRWSCKAGGRYSQCSFCMKLSVHENAVLGSRWSLFTVVAEARFSKNSGARTTFFLLLCWWKGGHSLGTLSTSQNRHRCPKKCLVMMKIITDVLLEWHCLLFPQCSVVDGENKDILFTNTGRPKTIKSTTFRLKAPSGREGTYFSSKIMVNGRIVRNYFGAAEHSVWWELLTFCAFPIQCKEKCGESCPFLCFSFSRCR